MSDTSRLLKLAGLFEAAEDILGTIDGVDITMEWLDDNDVPYYYSQDDVSLQNIIDDRLYKKFGKVELLSKYEFSEIGLIKFLSDYGDSDYYSNVIGEEFEKMIKNGELVKIGNYYVDAQKLKLAVDIITK